MPPQLTIKGRLVVNDVADDILAAERGVEASPTISG